MITIELMMRSYLLQTHGGTQKKTNISVMVVNSLGKRKVIKEFLNYPTEAVQEAYDWVHHLETGQKEIPVYEGKSRKYVRNRSETENWLRFGYTVVKGKQVDSVKVRKKAYNNHLSVKELPVHVEA